MNEQADSSRDLLQRLEGSFESFTASERQIANFILTNRGGIAFETAHSVAQKLEVSSITVGRFARKMGYRHFKDLKTGLRMTMSGVPWLVGDQVTRFIDVHGESSRSGLAEQAHAEGIPIIMLTDKFCDWIRKFTDHIIAVPTEVELFWSPQVSLSCVVNLLVNDVIGKLGNKLEKRLERLSTLYPSHVGHVGSPSQRRPSQS